MQVKRTNPVTENSTPDVQPAQYDFEEALRLSRKELPGKLAVTIFLALIAPWVIKVTSLPAVVIWIVVAFFGVGAAADITSIVLSKRALRHIHFVQTCAQPPETTEPQSAAPQEKLASATLPSIELRSGSYTVTEMMEAYSLDAVDHAARTFGIHLDFSIASVEQVERILATLHLSLSRGIIARVFSRGPDQQTIDQMTKMYGGYVGEVLRREAGGEWFIDEEISPGGRVIGLRKNGWRVRPPSRVSRRILEGEMDNVWVYFNVILKEKWRLAG